MLLLFLVFLLSCSASSSLSVSLYLSVCVPPSLPSLLLFFPSICLCLCVCVVSLSLSSSLSNAMLRKIALRKEEVVSSYGFGIDTTGHDYFSKLPLINSPHTILSLSLSFLSPILSVTPAVCLSVCLCLSVSEIQNRTISWNIIFIQNNMDYTVKCMAIPASL